MPKEDTQFNSETGRRAGAKSKRGRSLKTILKEVCEDGTIDEIAFIKSLYLNAMKGNSGIAKLIMEYREGKPAQDINHSGSIGRPVLECTPEQKAFIGDKDE